MKVRNLNRREFLKMVSQVSASQILFGEALAALIQTVAMGKSGLAHGNATTDRAFRWVDFRFNGAPARWAYDLFLHTSDAESNLFKTTSNSSLVNRYKLNPAGYYDGGTFSTVKINGLRVPYIWQFRVPAADGGTRPMAELLQSFLNIRGIYTGTSGHGPNLDLHYFPSGSPRSLPALAADLSSTPISAISSDPAFIFKSANNKSAVPVNLSTTPPPLAELLSPFRPSTSVAGIRADEGRLLQEIAAARNSLEKEERARSASSASIANAMKGARELIFSNFGDIEAQWAVLVAKYQRLISRSLAMTIPGINDRPIGRPASTRTPVPGSAGEKDLSYRYGDGRFLKCGDLRSIVQSDTNILDMAQCFALAEFVLQHGLSHSVSVNIRQLFPIRDGSAQIGHSYDEHFIGAMPAVLLSSLQAVAHASCMLELIGTLKALGIWNTTVINSSGEMNRSPLANGGGSDHSSTVNLALHSGAVSGPLVLGNIVSESSSTGLYPGTWGEAAPQPELGDVRIEPGVALNSVATILGVPPPVPGRPSLVRMNGGLVVPTIAPGKIVP